MGYKTEQFTDKIEILRKIITPSVKEIEALSHSQLKRLRYELIDLNSSLALTLNVISITLQSELD